MWTETDRRNREEIDRMIHRNETWAKVQELLAGDHEDLFTWDDFKSWVNAEGDYENDRDAILPYDPTISPLRNAVRYINDQVITGLLPV